MGIKKDYVSAAADTICQMNPSLDKEDVEKIVVRKMKQMIQDPTVTMDNDVTRANETIKLTDLCAWIEKKNPVVSGNATFYIQPDILESPTSNMLRELKKERKVVKKEMFKHAPESDEYRQLDLAQANLKVIMNAEYGASGSPMAAFYTKYSPAATTLMAQSIITTMAMFFEGYIGDNQKFSHINECFDWLNVIREKDEKIPKWVWTPSVEDVISRVRRKFYMYNMENDVVIEKYISNCNEDELTYIYYANNLEGIISKHKKIQDLFRSIFASLPLHEASNRGVPEEFKDRFKNRNQYNEWVSKEMFFNPYNVPDIIKNDIEQLVKIMYQLTFVKYLTPDSIVKLNYSKRNTILLVDTDSNVINANMFIEFILDRVFGGETFGRKRTYNEMICANVLAKILDGCVETLLDWYGVTHNMNEEARKELVMKNEYMFKRLFLMNKKKRYASSVVLREGSIMIPYKTDIKGVDFIKSGVTEEVTKRFTKMLEKHILFSDEIELHELMKDIKKLEGEVYNDLKNGGMKFLKLQTYKNEGAYQKSQVKGEDGKPLIDAMGTEVTVSGGWRIPVFRGVTAWNELNPSQKIYQYERVSLIKLIVTSVMDLDKIKDNHHNEYKLIIEKIFSSSNPDLQKAGLKVIAIPTTVKQIPDWIIDLIDYDAIISDVIGSFKSVLEALKIEGISIKTPHGKANVVSSLISI